MPQAEAIAPPAPPNVEASIPHHSGLPVDRLTIFPTPPPSEIGTLRSRGSNLAAGKFDFQGWARAVFAAVLVGPFLFGLLIASMVGVYLPMIAIGIAVGGICLWMLRPWPTCTYVGERGIARYSVVRGQKKNEVFIFSRECSASVQSERMHVRGVYVSTKYTFSFYNRGTKCKLKIEGDYYDAGRGIPSDSDWHFGNQGEHALAQFLLPDSLQLLSQGQVEIFALSSGMKIHLGLNSLIFETRGKQSVMRYEDLERTTVENGTVTLWTKGGRAGFLGIGQQGVFSFKHGAMSNARLFFYLLDHMVARAQSQ